MTSSPENPPQPSDVNEFWLLYSPDTEATPTPAATQPKQPNDSFYNPFGSAEGSSNIAPIPPTPVVIPPRLSPIRHATPVAPPQRRWYERKSKQTAPIAPTAIGATTLKLIERTEIPRLRYELGMVADGVGRIAVGSVARISEIKARKANKNLAIVEQSPHNGANKIVEKAHFRRLGASRDDAKKAARYNLKEKNGPAHTWRGSRMHNHFKYVDPGKASNYINPINYFRLNSQRRHRNKSEQQRDRQIRQLIHTQHHQNLNRNYSLQEATLIANKDHESRLNWRRGGFITSLHSSPIPIGSDNPTLRQTRNKPQVPKLKRNEVTGDYEPVFKANGDPEMRSLSAGETYLYKRGKNAQKYNKLAKKARAFIARSRARDNARIAALTAHQTAKGNTKPIRRGRQIIK